MLLPILAFALTSMNTSYAKTRYVEIWGSNTNPNCSRSQPCRNIQHAINQSGANDRIVVGPGEYFGNLTIFSHQSGLKLESTAGRFATIIRPGLDIDGLTIEAPRVRVGGKGKGFTFQGPAIALGEIPTTTGDGIIVNSEQARIEGNRFQWNESGLIFSVGTKATIRNNIAIQNKYAGSTCDACDRAIIQDNRVEYNGGGGIYIGSASPRASVRRNIATGNGNDGFSSSSFTGQQQRIQDNVAEQNDGNGFDMSLPIGNLMGNISVDNDSGGFVLDLRADSGSGAYIGRGKVKHNLSLDNGWHGFSLEDPDEAKIENNFAARNGPYGFAFYGGIYNGTPGFRNNSSLDHNCGLHNNLAEDLLFTGQYFGDHTVGDTCGTGDYVLGSNTRETPAPVRVNRARAVAGG